MKHVLYECDICDCYHPWEFNGDCRDDDNRTFPDLYAEKFNIDESDIEILSMDERIREDMSRINLWKMVDGITI